MCQHAVRYVLAYVPQRHMADEKPSKLHRVMVLQVSDLHLGHFNMVITGVEFLLITLLTRYPGYLIFLTLSSLL